MKPGNVLVTTDIEHRVPVSISGGRWDRYGFKAPKGEQFVVLYLGTH